MLDTLKHENRSLAKSPSEHRGETNLDRFSAGIGRVSKTQLAQIFRPEVRNGYPSPQSGSSTPTRA
jgi:hypothetical protein